MCACIDFTEVTIGRSDFVYIKSYYFMFLYQLLVDCGTPSSLSNGQRRYSSTIVGSRVTYTCNTGYRMTAGSSSRTCQSNHQWSGSHPTCTRKSTLCHFISFTYWLLTYVQKNCYHLFSIHTLSFHFLRPNLPVGSITLFKRYVGCWLSLQCIHSHFFLAFSTLSFDHMHIKWKTQTSTKCVCTDLTEVMIGSLTLSTVYNKSTVSCFFINCQGCVIHRDP